MIEVKDCVLGFGEGKDAIKKINLSIPEGSIYGFLGSNGAGKSTLMRLLCGVYKADSGSVEIDGEEVFNNSKAKENIFFVNDETIQFSTFTVKELKQYYHSIYENFSDEVYDELIDKLKLPKDKKLSAFSKGMKRQTAVIAGLSCRTKYLILDEAFDGLDPSMRKKVKDIISDDVFDRGCTVVVSSHNLTEISEICDHAMLIYNGEILFADELDNILNNYTKLQLVFRNKIVTKDDFVNAGVEVLGYEELGSFLNVVCHGCNKDVIAKVSKLNPEVCEAGQPNLEDIFIYEIDKRGYEQNVLEKD